jgi:hypothetical protein
MVLARFSFFGKDWTNQQMSKSANDKPANGRKGEVVEERD